MLLEDSPGAWQLSWELTVGWAPTSQADRWGRVSQLPRGRKGRWEVTGNKEPLGGGSCSGWPDRGETQLAGRVSNPELIPEADKELLKAFRQES